MSDESPPQQEPRLGPTAEPDKGAAPSSPPPSPPSAPLPAEPAGAAPENVRLKVRVPIEPPPAAPPAESSLPAGVPQATAPSASAEKAETSAKLKLKPKVVPPPSSTPPAPTPPAGEKKLPAGEPHDLPRKLARWRSASPVLSPPPSPVTRPPVTRPPVATEAKSGVAAPPPPAPPPIPEPPLLTSVEAKPHNLRLGLVTLILCGVVVLVFSGVGYRTYQRLKAVAAKPAPQPVAPARPAPAATKPSTTPAPAAPTTPGGRAIQKAREVVAAVAANRTGPTNEVTGSAPRSATTASATPAVVPPSQRFRIFVDRLKVGGVRVGPPARLFLGGVTYKPGDVIDQALGIVFAGVDVTAQEIVFKDGTGAEVRRRY